MSFREAARAVYRYVSPFGELRRLPGLPGRYVRFLRDWARYSSMGSDSPRPADGYPCLGDDTPTTGFDAHYFFQEAWASRMLAAEKPSDHVDVGSRLSFVATISAFIPVRFVDIRPMVAELSGCTVISGSILSLPFPDKSVNSISCLHVIEHIGLGRYGDPLDPEGSRKAALELERVMAPGGTLLLSTPVGRPRTMFNAHRIHSPAQVRAMFPNLELVEYGGVDDRGRFTSPRSFDELDDCFYACGFFKFIRPMASR